MALKSWSLASFSGATAEAPVTQTLVEAPAGKVIITLSLLVSNYGATDANVTVRRMSGATEKFKWLLTIPTGNSPFALDSKIVLEADDSLTIESDAADVAADCSGSEDFA